MRVPGAFSRRNGSNMSTDKNTRFVRGVSQKRQNWKFGPHVFTPSFPRRGIFRHSARETIMFDPQRFRNTSRN